MGISNKDDLGSVTGAGEKSTSWCAGASSLGHDFSPGLLADDNLCPAVWSEAKTGKKKKRNTSIAVGVPWI